MTRVLIVFAAFLVGFYPYTQARPLAQTTDAIMSVSDIKPGLTGTWKTVVDGTQIEEYNFKVLGVSPNFAGPNSPVIIAEATDASQILSGPVGGMSGSPCYIDGKLVGAYAYGYLWPKEQAIIGITPIKEMLKVFEKDSANSGVASSNSQPRPSGAIRIEDLPRPSQLLSRQHSETAGLRSALQSESTPAIKLPSSKRSSGAMPTLAPVPTPLFAAGVSAHTISEFRPYAEAMGLDLMSAPVGATSDLEAVDLVPGSPVGGVLLDGDFSFVAVGTCTWREGDNFLAFGHPFLQGGATDIPIAPAEIITIVRSVPSSFKLSNIGPIVGSITQDRLTAVAGEVGRMTPLTQYAVNVTDANGTTRTYDGNLFQNENMSPFLAILGLFQATSSTLESGEDQSYSITLHADYEGYDPISVTRGGAGQGGLMMTMFRFWDVLGMLAQNPFERPVLNTLTFDVRIANQREATVLERLQMLTGEPKPGDLVEVAIGLRGFREGAQSERIEVPIPAGTGGEKLSLFIGDAYAADNIDNGYSRTVASFGELLDYYRDSRDNQRLYVKLLRRSEGLRTQGRDLHDLPPSAQAVLESRRTVEPQSSIREVTLWETSLATQGAFNGSHRFSIPVAQR
ncbi:MAG: hypothetical protein ACQKBV_03895 [Puniceicoccales bacterium]